MENRNNSYTLIYNARIVSDDRVVNGYVTVAGEFITAVGEGEVPAGVMEGAAERIDLRGRLVIPGAIDEHVHFRDPGLTHKADMATESRAAVAGGVTSFIDMPNTNPVTVTVKAVEEKLKRAAEVSAANYGFFIGATNSNLDELKQADYTRVAGVKLFLGSSTGNMLVDSDSTIVKIFKEVPALIAVHAESEEIIRRNREAALELHGEDLPISMHPKIRSRKACAESTRHAVELAKATGARLHVLHISTADELQYFELGPLGDKRITAETCPQYLIFNDKHYASRGSRIKCNPAIKTEDDRKALLGALTDGRIDVIATDHAPHLPEEKQGNVLTAVSGMPMIQFSVPVMLELAKLNSLDPAMIVRKMAHNPAEIFGIDRRGYIREGYYADLAVVDDNCEPYEITDDMVLSRCGWTPLIGIKLTNRVDMTMVNGQIVYRHGIIFASNAGKALKFHSK